MSGPGLFILYHILIFLDISQDTKPSAIPSILCFSLFDMSLGTANPTEDFRTNTRQRIAKDMSGLLDKQWLYIGIQESFIKFYVLYHRRRELTGAVGRLPTAQRTEYVHTQWCIQKGPSSCWNQLKNHPRWTTHLCPGEWLFSWDTILTTPKSLPCC